VEWHSDHGYDMLTISDPVSGEWKIRAEADPQNRVMVVTDLKMHTSELPNRLMLGQTLPFEVSFSDHGRLITKPAFLKMVEVAARQYDAAGEQEPKPLLDRGGEEDETAGDGRFSMHFGGDTLNSGRGELVINAKGRTFVREKRMTFEVVSPVKLQLTPDESGKQLLLQAQADAQMIVPASLQARIWLENGAGEREAVTLEGEAGSYSGLIDLQGFSGSRRVVLEVEARALAGAPISYFDAPAEVEGLGAPPPPPSPPPTVTAEPLAEPTASPPAEPAASPPAEPVAEESGWIGATIWFSVINLLLAAAGAGLFWWLRRRRQRSMVQLVDEDEAAANASTQESGSTDDEEKPA
jgi:uncharacterized protein (TIGR03503 family)